MGSGHNKLEDTPRRVSRLAVSTGDVELGSEDGQVEPVECAATRVIEFRTRGHSNPIAGDPVSVEVADPPLLLDHKGIILGYLVGPGITQVRVCLADGWRFEGEVTRVADTGGMATVRGLR